LASGIARFPQVTSAFRKIGERPGLSWQVHSLLFLVCLVAIVSRKPDALLNPEFYAEDGKVWYTDAYSAGWLHSLSLPFGGYLNTLQRLLAAITLLVPFHSVPLAMNLIGIVVQVLPVNVLLSNRCTTWGPLYLRLLYALVYIALPNSPEVHIVITNSQFHLALVAFFVATATPPPNVAWKVFDVTVFAIMAVTGPFCFVLLPIVLIFWRRQRDRWHVVLAGILLVLGAVQTAEVFFALSAQRPPVDLGANFPLFVRLLGSRLFLAPLGGTLATRMPFAMLVTITVAAIALLVYSALKASLPLRLFLMFSAALLAASLARPLITNPVAPAWILMLRYGGANRYWFFPTLAFLWSAIWCTTHRTWIPARAIAICVLLISLRGVVRNWPINRFFDDHFQMYAAQFEAAQPGEIVTIPIFPPGWYMQLKKK
jgi:hypothetical protein